ncbi:hypothetical protein D3C77_377460 [compost metagenome]
MNGQQQLERKFATPLSWSAVKIDVEFWVVMLLGQLSCKDIAHESGLAKSVLLQNPRVEETLKMFEVPLCDRVPLPLLKVADTDFQAVPVIISSPQTAAKNACLTRLEAENAARRAEVVPRCTALEHYRLLDRVLCSSGRLLR